MKNASCDFCYPQMTMQSVVDLIVLVMMTFTLQFTNDLYYTGTINIDMDQHKFAIVSLSHKDDKVIRIPRVTLV